MENSNDLNGQIEQVLCISVFNSIRQVRSVYQSLIPWSTGEERIDMQDFVSFKTTLNILEYFMNPIPSFIFKAFSHSNMGIHMFDELWACLTAVDLAVGKITWIRFWKEIATICDFSSVFKYLQTILKNSKNIINSKFHIASKLEVLPILLQQKTIALQSHALEGETLQTWARYVSTTLPWNEKKRLIVCNCLISDSDINDIFSIISPSHIFELNLRRNCLTFHDFKTLDVSSILHLNLSDNCISAQGVVKLCNTFLLPSRSTLQSLVLDRNNLGKEGLEHICTALTELKRSNFNSLSVSSCNITPGGWKFLSQFLGSFTCFLVNLNIAGNFWTVSELSCVIHSAVEKGLKKLTLAPIWDGDFYHQSQNIVSGSCHALPISLGDIAAEILLRCSSQNTCYGIGSLGMKSLELSEMGMHSTLEASFFLSQSRDNHASLDVSFNTNALLSSMPNISHLTRIYLERCNLTFDQIDRLFLILHSTQSQIQTLSLKGNDLSSSGFPKSNATSFLSSKSCQLFRLDASQMLTREACFLLDRSFVKHSISHLDLSFNGIQSEDIAKVVPLGFCDPHQYTFLNLSHNNISNPGALSLSSLLTTSHQIISDHHWAIDLSSNNISDIGVFFLSQFLLHSSLSLCSLFLFRNPISPSMTCFLMRSFTKNSKIVHLGVCDCSTHPHLRNLNHFIRFLNETSIPN